ncbi:flavin reductase family protein [Sphaerisporangium rubeum]|uniref:Flavin reductase (DIM6/NTAB) family NADH-FMN oxidoreductase RutF n=2 Tax=Sphaerisporangium rubeum TaxID=321317 RepID=A0A7X0IIU1_9ACTN|nr:flavin reductase family protein [Sphaerisporangium rubeum]MBB6476009.1 flavin reductase (DIM6/NTAB) family NADH-FMN oxidoreductase RutF [Sphaerisporangium rubeum]
MNEFTEAMRQLAAGVAVVTVREGRDDIGTTVTTFASLSLDPPMAALSLDSAGYLCEVMLRHDRWAVTLLSAGQSVIASRFATPGRPSARLLLAGVPHHRGSRTEAMIIDGGVAALEAETTRVVPGGDHTLFLATVIAVDYIDPSHPPLVRLRGRYRPLT